MGRCLVVDDWLKSCWWVGKGPVCGSVVGCWWTVGGFVIHHNCSHVRLARLFASDAGAIVVKSHWHDCFQMTLAQMFSSDPDTIVRKWHWHDCFEVILGRLFPSRFCFLIYILFCSLFDFNLGIIVPCTKIMADELFYRDVLIFQSVTYYISLYFPLFWKQILLFHENERNNTISRLECIISRQIHIW